MRLYHSIFKIFISVILIINCNNNITPEFHKLFVLIKPNEVSVTLENNIIKFYNIRDSMNFDSDNSYYLTDTSNVNNDTLFEYAKNLQIEKMRLLQDSSNNSQWLYKISFLNNSITVLGDASEIQLDKIADKYNYDLRTDILILNSKKDSLPFSKNFTDYSNPEILVLANGDSTVVPDNLIKFSGLTKQSLVLDANQKKIIKMRGNGTYWEIIQ